MKRIILVLIVLALGFSCKSTKKAAHQTAIDTDSSTQVITETSQKVEEIAEEPVVVRTEEVRVVEDKVESEATFDFYVIIGSFSLNANADTYKKEMIAKGFSPTVLISETGLYRVAVEQTQSESQARSLIARIRSQYPEHNDVWLLKRK